MLGHALLAAAMDCTPSSGTGCIMHLHAARSMSVQRAWHALWHEHCPPPPDAVLCAEQRDGRCARLLQELLP